ncbi:PiggyBac transposable element-derived protein 3 [Elysia marginata]|uniref:PiggyBac transposable element-derived protein 3 n=1 Tax=Elysia marginata TaxID=1093978 RepID=A0AAV4GKJ9_9GAST|nr:PiggyBac transposable element-derived protein 3 [Elysia marginata]
MLPGVRLVACRLARLNHQDPRSNAHGSHLTANKVPNSRERSRFRGIEESDRTTEVRQEDGQKTKQAMKKQPRGTMDYQLEATSNTVIVRWNDNSVVTVASTGYGVQPLQKAKRWSREKKQFITIAMPNAVAQYNANMGGTDRMDQNLGAYRPTIRIKKCWWPIFRFAIGTAAQNAWLLYRKSEAAKRLPMDQLAFLRSIATTYIMRHRVKLPKPTTGLRGRPKNENLRWPADVRYDGKDHYITKAPGQHRCAVCKKNTTKMCIKCPRC